MSIRNFPRNPKIILRKPGDLSLAPWRSKCAKSTQDYFLLGGSSCEALREKVELLGRFQGIFLKFHILKIKFHHEKIIFFGVDFFPDKVWLWIVRKWALQWAYSKNWQNGPAIFQFSNNFVIFSKKSKKHAKLSENWKMTEPFCQFVR